MAPGGLSWAVTASLLKLEPCFAIPRLPVQASAMPSPPRWLLSPCCASDGRPSRSVHCSRSIPAASDHFEPSSQCALASRSARVASPSRAPLEKSQGCTGSTNNYRWIRRSLTLLGADAQVQRRQWRLMYSGYAAVGAVGDAWSMSFEHPVSEVNQPLRRRRKIAQHEKTRLVSWESVVPYHQPHFMPCI